MKNLKELKLLKLGPFTIPDIGGIDVDFGINFSEIPAVLPFTAWESKEQSANIVARDITTKGCLLDYVNGSIVGIANIYVIGY